MKMKNSLDPKKKPYLTKRDFTAIQILSVQSFESGLHICTGAELYNTKWEKDIN
jgi:hypothetical protein